MRLPGRSTNSLQATTRIPSIRLPGVAPTSDRHTDYTQVHNSNRAHNYVHTDTENMTGNRHIITTSSNMKSTVQSICRGLCVNITLVHFHFESAVVAVYSSQQIVSSPASCKQCSQQCCMKYSSLILK